MHNSATLVKMWNRQTLRTQEKKKYFQNCIIKRTEVRMGLQLKIHEFYKTNIYNRKQHY